MSGPSAFAVDPPPGGGYPNQVTALGQDALFSLVPGSLGMTTAIGFDALYGNTTGYENTAVGDSALFSNTDGFGNVAIGDYVLYSNTTGVRNTAIGSAAMLSNTVGFDNTATGLEVLEDNTTGDGNTGNGFSALTFTTTGSYNTAVGNVALAFNSTGSYNTAVGQGALNANTTGSYNIALGQFAGYLLTTGDNNIDIGNDGVAGESGTIRIGTRREQTKTFIAGISKTTVAGGVGVVVNTNGQLGTVTSSARYKEAIQPMATASEALLALQPVTFRYKKDLDPEAIPQFGLIAEQVAKVDPDLVALDEEGKPYTVRYEAVNAMLLNEFFKEHRKVEDQARKLTTLEATIAEQQKDFRATASEQQLKIDSLAAALRAQSVQIQKVNEQLQQTAPRLIANDE